MATNPATNPLVLLGRIGAAHGIKGEVRITPYTADPESIAGYGPLTTDRPGETITILSLRPAKSGVVARIKGVSDRNGAEKLNGRALYCPRDRLPEPEEEDEFYHADLIGLEARLTDGTVVGTVSALPNFGAGDLIEIRDAASGATALYPFTKAVVPEIDLKAGHLTLVPPAETGDENEPEDPEAPSRGPER